MMNSGASKSSSRSGRTCSWSNMGVTPGKPNAISKPALINTRASGGKKLPSDAGCERAQKPEDQDDDQHGADNAAAAHRAEARITEAATGQQNHQQYDQKQ